MALSDTAHELIAHITFFGSISIELPLPVLYKEREVAESIAKYKLKY